MTPMPGPHGPHGPHERACAARLTFTFFLVTPGLRRNTGDYSTSSGGVHVGPEHRQSLCMKAAATKRCFRHRVARGVSS